jgi:photosystem II stability/assembly factor-like uncharacterized protein
MKIEYLLIILCLLITDAFSQWRVFQTSTQLNHHDVCVVNRDVVWVCGVNGSVVRTTNGGQSWDIANYGLGFNNIFVITAVDQNHAWIMKDDNKVYVTTNGGLNWDLQFQYEGYVNGVHFFNASTGIILNGPYCGPPDTCYLFITRNGGKDWYISPAKTISECLATKALDVLDTNFIWFFDRGNFYKLQGGLESAWRVYSFKPDVNLNGLFKDSLVGLVTDGAFVYKTSNGGVNWYLFNQDLCDIFPVNFTNVKGTDYVILYGSTDSPPRYAVRMSYDFCNVWQRMVVFPGNAQLHYMDAYDTNSIWLSSCAGLLYKYDYRVIGILNDNKQLPDGFVLYKNYPNPFNPRTRINFDIPKFCHVKLTVYNALGSEVASLADKEFEPGHYEIDWNGTEFASGVYIFRLETESFTDAKRMVLLK